MAIYPHHIRYLAIPSVALLALGARVAQDRQSTAGVDANPAAATCELEWDTPRSLGINLAHPRVAVGTDQIWVAGVPQVTFPDPLGWGVVRVFTTEGEELPAPAPDGGADPRLVAGPGDGELTVFWPEPAAGFREGERIRRASAEVLVSRTWDGVGWSTREEVVRAGSISHDPYELSDPLRGPDGRLWFAVTLGRPGGGGFSSAVVVHGVPGRGWAADTLPRGPRWSGGGYSRLAFNTRQELLWVLTAGQADTLVRAPDTNSLHRAVRAHPESDWDGPERILRGGSEPFSQPRLTIATDGTVHLLTARAGSGMAFATRLWYARSVDGGASWSEGREVAHFPDPMVVPQGVFEDPAGRVHAVASQKDMAGSPGVLVRFELADEEWGEGVPLLPWDPDVREPRVAAIAGDGLVVAYNSPPEGADLSRGFEQARETHVVKGWWRCDPSPNR